VIIADNQATFWPEAVAFSVLCLCLLLAFIVYRLTGGKWPDDESGTETQELDRDHDRDVP
jgi:Ca2+/Na+ antiporter